MLLVQVHDAATQRTHDGIAMRSASKHTVQYITINANSYTVQYPVLRTVQSTSHFSSLTDLFTQTPSRLLWEASSHMLQLYMKSARTHIHHYL